MRIAILSDIHGNALALDVALADVQRNAVDRVVCLGDAIQGGPQPAEEEFQKLLIPYLPRILTGGHTHLQQIRRIGVSDSFFFNPGSIGLAYSHQHTEESFRADPWAEYAILTAERPRLSVEFRRISYPAKELIEVYRRSGRPHAEDAVVQYQP